MQQQAGGVPQAPGAVERDRAERDAKDKPLVAQQDKAAAGGDKSLTGQAVPAAK